MACLVSNDTDDLYQWGESDGESDVSSTDEEDANSEEEAGLDSDRGMYDSPCVSLGLSICFQAQISRPSP